MSINVPTEFFYHSFPRPSVAARNEAALIAKGLAILKSICTRGLLLTPELVGDWYDPSGGGAGNVPREMVQRRICFTRLEPAGLLEHSKQFGPFALEWDTDQLLTLGAIPVFYVPRTSGATTGLSAFGSLILVTLADVQRLLRRMAMLTSFVETSASPDQFLDLTLNGTTTKTDCTVKGASQLLGFLGKDLKSISQLESSIVNVSTLFYPTEDSRYTDSLGYYRQREWRIVGSVLHNGLRVFNPTTDSDITDLMQIDERFFGKIIDFQNGPSTVAKNSHLFLELDGKLVISYARRLIVPRAAIAEAREIVENKLPVDELEAISLT